MEDAVPRYSKSGCPIAETLPRDPVPFFANGNLNFKAHDVGWLVAGLFSLVASSCSIWLILKHLSFFYHPSEQRIIVRILFMPILYAWCSFFSYYFVHQALYWQLARDCYEAIILGSFFYLLLSYLSNPRPTRDEPFPRPYRTRSERAAQLTATVKHVHVEKWIWPLGRVTWRCQRGGPREGESFLWLMRVLVGQYVIVRPLTTLASVVAEYTGYYCLASWSPKFVHVWASASITVSVTVAMYVVLQLYVTLKEDLSPYSPVLKFLSVKLCIFLTFWQESSLSLLVTLGVIQNRTYWSAEEIVVGISSLLSCLEMMLFAFLHVKAFSYLPYRALASPVSLDRDDAVDVAERKDARHLTFAEWSAWHDEVEQRDKDLSRLATVKLPKKRRVGAGGGEGDLLPTVSKPDGTPILKRTKKWPAFVKCLRVTDLVRELGDETKWVARRGRVEVTDELLLEDRRDDHEALVGVSRPKPTTTAAKSDVETEQEKLGRTGGETVARSAGVDAELRRLRETRSGSSRRTKIDADGNRVLREPRASTRQAEEDDRSQLAETHRQRDDDCDGAERHDDEAQDLPNGWWAGWNGSLARASRSAAFRQVPGDDRSFEPNAGLSHPPLGSDTPRISSSTIPSVVVMGQDYSIQVPPAHRFDSFSRRDLARPRLGFAGPTASPRLSLNESELSLGHLPRTTLRPPSFGPPPRLGSRAQLAPPSPPPFSHLESAFPPRAAIRRSVEDLPDPSSSSLSFSRAIPPLHDGSPSAAPLAPPPAAFFSAGALSSISRGLPKGAAPTLRRL
ncbi:hypothetical protein JCM3766R1_000890 [Sporobolomyces carnicolor]